jgi:hypothetical protein
MQSLIKSPDGLLASAGEHNLLGAAETGRPWPPCEWRAISGQKARRLPMPPRAPRRRPSSSAGMTVSPSWCARSPTQRSATAISSSPMIGPPMRSSCGCSWHEPGEVTRAPARLRATGPRLWVASWLALPAVHRERTHAILAHVAEGHGLNAVDHDGSEAQSSPL